MSAAGLTYLVVADDSPEFPAAALYAALRAKATGGRVVMLAAAEPVEHAHWLSVGEEMRAEAHDSAMAQAARHAAEIEIETGIAVDIVVREGEVRDVLRALLDEDRAVNLIVLAASAGREGPGPLVSALARGGGIGGRALPVLVVPGALSKAEIRALALPGVG
jgi:hypothetical protein